MKRITILFCILFSSILFINKAFTQTKISIDEAFFDSLTNLVNSQNPDICFQAIDSISNQMQADTLNLKYAICLLFKAYVSNYSNEDFEKSLQLYLQAYNIALVSDTSLSLTFNIQALILSGIGTVYKVQENIQGLDYFIESNKMFKKINNNKKVASNYRQISTYFSSSVDTDSKLFFQTMGLEYLKKDPKISKTSLAYTYRGIGNVYSDNNSDSCLYYFEKAYTTLIEDSLALDPDKLNLSAGAAEIALLNKKFDIAKKYSAIAYNLTKQLYGENSIIAAHICFQFVQIFGANNQTDSVNYYANKGFEIYNTQGEKYIWKINAYNHLSRIEKSKKNYQKALKLAHKAMFINALYIPEPENMDEIIPLDSTYYSYEKLGNAIYNKLELYHLLYKSENKPEYLNKSFNTNIKLLDYLLNVHYKNSISTDNTSLSFSKGVNQSIDHLLWTTNQAQKLNLNTIKIETSYPYFYRLKAGLLNELINTVEYTNSESAMKNKLTIDSLRTELKTLLFIKKYNTLSSDSLSRINNSLEKDYITLLKLKDELKSFEKQVDNQDNILKNYQEILSNIAPEQAIIDYYYNDSSLYTFVSTNKQTKIIQQNIDASFENLLKQYLRFLKTSDPKFTSISKELNTILIDPIYQHIPEINELIIIPYKLLFNIPFEALVDSNGTFLISKNAVSYNYSIRYKKKKQPESNKSIIAYAPSFETNLYISDKTRSTIFTDDDMDEFDFLDYQKNEIVFLPYAKQEVLAINQIFRKSAKIVLGTEATEEHFKTNAKNYQIIHVASHAYSSAKNPELSGIFFNSNSNKLNDGYLFKNELSAIDLKADLVVLSACQSGKGKIEAFEGAIALSRAFYAQGVSNIISSLWKVDDKNTMLLMKYFYIYLHDKHSYSKALQLAKIKCINNNMLPIDWAGFTLIGE